MIEFEKAAQEKDAQRAKQLCQAVDTIPVARVFANILKAKDGDLHNWEQTISAGTQKELHLMEKGLGTLSTIAAVGPLFGFMGTVLGMIKVFMKIQQTAGGVDISLLAGGIWEALITTVAGLVVGILALSFYNQLIDKIDYEAVDLQEKANQIVGEFLTLYGSQEKKDYLGGSDLFYGHHYASFDFHLGLLQFHHLLGHQGSIFLTPLATKATTPTTSSSVSTKKGEVYLDQFPNRFGRLARTAAREAG